MDEASASDVYAVLGVARDAPAREIRRAYRRLARQHHPDLNRHPVGAERFAALAHAYEILRDPARRAHYDGTLPLAVLIPPPTRSPERPIPPPAASAGMRRGILELSAAEAVHVARHPLELQGVDGRMILLPPGTGHGDQITISDGGRAAVLKVVTNIKT